MGQMCHFHGPKSSHITLDCNLLKNLMAKKPSAPGQDKKDPSPDGTGKFPEERATLMIFGGSSGYESGQRQKLKTCEVNAIEPAVPQWLRWSKSVISFYRSDYPDHIPYMGRFPPVVDPLICGVRLTKVLMDGGSGLNTLYVKTLNDMKFPRSTVKPTGAPFHKIVPGKMRRLLRQIALDVTFGTLPTFGQRPSPLSSLTSQDRIMPSRSDPATPSSWLILANTSI